MDLPLGKGFGITEVVEMVKVRELPGKDPFKEFLEQMREEARARFTSADLERGLSPEQREEFKRHIRAKLEEYNRFALNRNLPPIQGDPERIAQEVLDAILGLGPELEELLRRQDVEDIYIIGPRAVYVQRAGSQRVEKLPITFSSEEHLLDVVRRALAGTGRQVSRALPFVDARLPDGSRMHVIIDPCAEPSPQITIRRHRMVAHDPEDLVRLGTITPQAMEFLKLCVEAGVNILVTGGTGVGKTTLLNVLCSVIPDGLRVITIEDTRELQFKHEPPPVHLVTREPGLEEAVKPVPQRELVRQTLRMRPYWIVCGEVRGPEAWDLADLGQSGHCVMGAIHAEDARSAIARFVNYAWRAVPGFTEEMVTKNVVGAIELIVVLGYREGKRKVVEITEIVGRIEQGTVVARHPIFEWRNGSLQAMGQPQVRLRRKFERAGVDVDHLFLPAGGGSWTL